MSMRKKTAQAIAESTSEVLGYGVLVTDEKGVIIGCNDRSRLGAFHAPSLDVLAGGRPLLTTKEEADALGIRPGYTAPITLAGQAVGTVSISGLPHSVERFGRLVRRQAEVLLMEQEFLEMRLRRQWAIRDLAESVMLYQPEVGNEAMLIEQGRELGFDLGRCRVAAVLDFHEEGGRSRPSVSERTESFGDMTLNLAVNFLPRAGGFVGPLRGQRLLLLLAPGGELPPEDEALSLCGGLIEHLRARGVEAEVGVGPEAEGLPRLAWSARLAREALGAGRALGMRLCPARALGPEMLLSYLPPARKRQHLDQTLGGRELAPELIETFLAWCRNPFAAARAAKELSIHRNTLQYRLKKLHELLGLDPWNFHDAFALWAALILKRFDRSGRGEGA